MTVLPRSPTVLNGILPMRTGCGSVLTAALNVDRLNLIQSQAAKALDLGVPIVRVLHLCMSRLVGWEGPFAFPLNRYWGYRYLCW